MSTEDLLAFLTAATSPFHAVDEAVRRVTAAGLERWVPGTASVDAGWWSHDGMFVAWDGRGVDTDAAMTIIGAHTDSPNLRLRPHATRHSAGFNGLDVEPYGGLLANSWLDRDLGISGRLYGRDGSSQLVRRDDPLLRIPQLAIHLDRQIHTDGLRLNPQQHLQPVFSIGGPVSAELFIAECFAVDPAEVAGWELMLHDTLGAALTGLNGQFLASARLDNLVSCWAAVTSLLTRPPDADTVAVVCLFDHEEVGSTSITGADGSVFEWLLGEAIRGGGVSPLMHVADGSLFISADMSHGWHPNYPDRHEENHRIIIGGGPAIKTNSQQRYATSARGASVVRGVADAHDIALQEYSHRADLACGSTIGPTVAARIGMTTVDLGAPMLGMHSCREMMATSDVDATLALFGALFAR